MKALDNPRSLAAVFLLAMLVSILIPHAYSSTLALTVFTTKPSYLIADDITVCGNLTYNGSPVPSWPVAIEVQDPSGIPVVTRTAQTNTSGTYILTFKLPTNARLGTYTVYVSAGYKGETAANSTTFLIGPVHNMDTRLSYMTIQEAINTPETLNGHTIFVETGTYYEHVVVNKTVSLIGENRDSTIIDGNATGTVVYITVNSVTISSFTLQNSGVFPDSGIHLDSASNSSIVGNKITNNDLDCIWLFDSPSNYICGNDIANYWNGIYLYASSSNTISGNNITADYGYGIGVRYSSNYNVISENRITNSGYGVYLDYSSNTNITGNNITANTDGIWLNPASDNCIFGNSITNNDGGVYLRDSFNNSIVGNDIRNNEYGLWLAQASDNAVYHNNFAYNTKQAYSSGFVNVWDDGYPSGGNYWSDYSGTDSYRGSHQNETGSDGIGDTPYAIDENNQDKYPFTKSYPWGLHDIGIAGLTTSKTVVGQGFNLNINITIFNYGDNTETFNVTVYCNETVITLPNEENYTTVTLASEESTTIPLTWNTTGFAYGNYTISAYAPPVEGETSTADNTLVDGCVFVTIPGDINGDRRVNVLDAILIANSFNSKPGDANWNPNADINCDDKVNILDCIVLANHFGQSWT